MKYNTLCLMSCVFIVACGGSFTAPTGTLITPYWPDPYPHRKSCSYSLEASEDQVIEVTFLDFGIEASQAAGACEYDNLIVSCPLSLTQCKLCVRIDACGQFDTFICQTTMLLLYLGL